MENQPILEDSTSGSNEVAEAPINRSLNNSRMICRDRIPLNAITKKHIQALRSKVEYAALPDEVLQGILESDKGKCKDTARDYLKVRFNQDLRASGMKLYGNPISSTKEFRTLWGQADHDEIRCTLAKKAWDVWYKPYDCMGTKLMMEKELMSRQYLDWTYEYETNQNKAGAGKRNVGCVGRILLQLLNDERKKAFNCPNSRHGFYLRGNDPKTEQQYIDEGKTKK
jgi:hypothetical protein